MNDAVTTNSKGIIKIRKIKDLNSLFILALSFMFFGQNSYLDMFLLALIFGVFTLNLNKDVFFFYYFAIIFFEPVLVLPFGLGSVFRVYQILFLMKILFDAKNRVVFTVPPIHKSFLAVMLITWSVFTNQGMSTVMSMIINLVILLYIFSRSSTSKRRYELYSQMLFIMFLFSFLSGIYGLYNGADFAYGGFSRLSGTIGDPNYTALFYLLGIFSLLGTDEIKSFKIKAVLFSVMCIFILLTVSLTGIVGLAILLVFYYLFKDKKLALLLMVAIIIFAVCVYYLPIESGALYGLKTRMAFSITSIADGDFASLTSNRFDLFSYYISYFFTQGTGAILFGGQNIIGGSERQNMLNLFGLVSHNSYIDMLFAIGVIGTAFILACFIYEIIKNIISYTNSKHEYYLAFAFLKLTILWFCMGLSIFPFRYFLTYMML